MPNDDKKIEDLFRFFNLDIDPRQNRFNPDARGYLEMGYDVMEPLRRSPQMPNVGKDMFASPMPQAQNGKAVPMPNANRPQIDPRLDAIMRMFSQRVG